MFINALFDGTHTGQRLLKEVQLCLEVGLMLIVYDWTRLQHFLDLHECLAVGRKVRVVIGL